MFVELVVAELFLDGFAVDGILVRITIDGVGLSWSFRRRHGLGGALELEIFLNCKSLAKGATWKLRAHINEERSHS